MKLPNWLYCLLGWHRYEVLSQPLAVMRCVDCRRERWTIH